MKTKILVNKDNPILFENKIVRNIFYLKQRNSKIFTYNKDTVIKSALNLLKIISCSSTKNIGNLAKEVNDCVTITRIDFIPKYHEKVDQILNSKTNQELHNLLFDFLKEVTHTEPDEELILDIIIPKSTLEYLLNVKGITSIKKMSSILNVSEVNIKRQFEYMGIL